MKTNIFRFLFKCNKERLVCNKNSTMLHTERHTVTIYTSTKVKIRFSQTQQIQKKPFKNANTQMKNNTELKVATGADPVLYESETLSGMLIRFVEIKRDQYKFISNSVDGTSSRRCACRISTRSVDTTETVRTHAETRDSF